jgi:lysophospholipase L1-like esterase
MSVTPLRLLAFAVTALLALVACELGLRACAPPEAFRIWTPNVAAVFTPRPDVLPGISGPSRFRVDPLGFRSDGRRNAEEPALLALGGSTTECLYLDQTEAWPALLEAELRARSPRGAWVANAGRSGRTTRDHVTQVRHLLAQHDFERVLLLTGVNDLCTWLATGTVPEASAPDDLARAFDVVPRALAGGPWWKRTAAWHLARRARERWSPAALAQDPEGDVYVRWRAHRQAAPRVRTELPEMTAVLAAFAAELRAIDALCRAAGSELVLVTQPALWSAELAPEHEALLWMGGVGAFQSAPGCEFYAPAALAAGLRRFDAELTAVAAERGRVLLDLASELDGDPRCFYDDVHFNEAGARRVADFLARELAALPPH